MIGECRIIRCFHGRYAADHRAGCIVEGDAGGNGGIVVTQADSNPCGAAVDVGSDEIVLDALFRSVQQVDITENAVHAEHILIFHVTAIAPFQHEDRQMVGAVLQKLRYIELACGMGDLTVPDKLTVEPDIEAGGNALEVQKCTRGSGILLVGEVVEVSAAGVLFGNIRRISGKWITDVGVLFDFGKIKKIAKSANMLLSIDIHDFLPIEKEVYDYVALLGRLDDFRKIGVPIQCDVDDARLLQGFHNRKAKIIKGDICEERGHRRLMRDEGETKLTPQEQSLNEEIEKLQDQWPYLMNEIFFIDYLKNPTYERGLAAKSKILVCFNDELLAAFLSAYKKANISEQQEMLTILKEISFRGGAVERDETDTEVTRKNLEKLENALNSEVEHTSDAVKKFYANRHLETVKQIRQKFLNTREM